MLNNFKEKLTNISTNGLNIPISSSMIEQLIRMKSGKQDVTVKITPEFLVIHGTTEVKKMMFTKNVSFRVALKPIQMNKRSIQFELVAIEPVDINFISSKIFNRPPFLDYTNRTITMDFNAWDVVKKVPVGNIKSFEMVEDAITIKLSL
jgi:hypothetical protein